MDITGMLAGLSLLGLLGVTLEQGLSAAERANMGTAARCKMEREFDETLVHRKYLDALRQVGVSGS